MSALPSEPTYLHSRVTKLEDFSHTLDKKVDRLIDNQSDHADQLKEMNAAVQEIKSSIVQEQTKWQFISKVLNSKPLFFFSIMLLLVFTEGHDNAIEALINKVF